MKRLDSILQMSEIISEYRKNEHPCKDENKLKIINSIFDFVISLPIIYSEEINMLEESIVRFSDYYDRNTYHGNEILEYFEENYEGNDQEKLLEIFSLYVLLENIPDLIVACEFFDSYDELYDELNNNFYFDDVTSCIDFLNDRKNKKEKDFYLDFQNPENKYKIFFSGASLRDVEELPKEKISTFIRTLSGALAKHDYIPDIERVEHIYKAYNFPLNRVHMSRDYRIAFVRSKDATIILGVALKHGKNEDYTRYDPIARKSSEIERELQEFLNGTLSKSHQHFKIIEILENHQKSKNNRNNKNNKIA